MDEAVGVEPACLLPDPGQHVVGEGICGQFGQRGAMRVAHHEDGSAGAGHPGRDNLRRTHAGAPGGQHHVGLVLHLLQAGQLQGPAALLVEHGAPELGEELGLGLIPAQHLDADPSPGPIRGKARRPCGWRDSRATPSAGTPSSSREASTWGTVGRPAGDPKARWMAAANSAGTRMRPFAQRLASWYTRVNRPRSPPGKVLMRVNS